MNKNFLKVIPIILGFSLIAYTSYADNTTNGATNDSSPSNLSPGNPTLANPTTANPATVNPTSANPTTANPTTANPTSANPTSANPTSSNPTQNNLTPNNPTPGNSTQSNSGSTAPNPTNSSSTDSTATPLTKDDWLKSVVPMLPDLICKGFQNDTQVKARFVQINMTYEKCVTAIPDSVSKCQQQLYASFPDTIDKDNASTLGKTLGECIGKDFATKYLVPKS